MKCNSMKNQTHCALRTLTGCLALVPAIAGTMIGCSPGPLDSPWAPRSPLGEKLTLKLIGDEPSGTPHTAVYEEPSGSITLNEALSATILRSPSLAASQYAVRVQEALSLQDSRLPNPEIELEIENFGGTGDSSGFSGAETTLALSQVIELGGKRTRRQRIGSLQAQSAGWAYEIRRIDVLSKTATDFIGVLSSEEQLRIADGSLQLAERVHQAVTQRVETGKVSPLDQSRSAVELAQAQLEREQAARAASSARTRLSSNWGSATPIFETVRGNFNDIEEPPVIATLIERVIETPELAQWALQTAIRQEEIRLAIAHSVPDLTLRAGVKYSDESDDTSFIAGISAPLQIFDRNADAIRASRLRATGDVFLHDAARIQVESALVEAHQRLESSYMGVQIIQSRVMPNAEHAFRAANEAFVQGKINALDLFDAERTLIAVRRQETQALTQYHLAVIECERLIGAPLFSESELEGSEQ